ncbi:amino acid adenylation domain-containing protein [Crossiella sp. NPDC003009]
MGGALTRDAVREAVAAVLGVAPESLAEQDDLLQLGLDSIRLMQLVGRWRRAGVRVSAAELAEHPTLGEWCRRLGESQEVASPAVVPEVDPTAPFGLTPVQHAYWIGRRDDQRLGGVGCHACVELTGPPLEAGRLEAAVRALAARHPMLRARFHEDGTQQVLPESPWPGLTVRDLTGLARPVAALRLAEVREQLGHRRLAVQRGEVFDVQLTQLDGGSVLHLNIDLLVADVLSIQILLADLAELYVGRGEALPPLDFSFPQYLAQREAARAADRERAKAYWQDQLDELPGGPQLPLATAPETVHRPWFRRRTHRLSTTDWQRFQERARARGVTAAMALATAYAEALGRWSAAPRFLLNLPLFDRQQLHAQVPHLVADFTNLVLLPVDVSAPQSFVDRAKAVQTTLRRNVEHADYSGIEVLRELARADAGRERSAPVVFACNLGGEFIPPRVRAELGEWSWMLSQTPQVWLDHQVYEDNGELLLAWDAVDELFPEGLVDDLFDGYTRLVGHLAAKTDTWDLPAPLELPAAQRAVRQAVNASTRVESGKLLHEDFFAWAQRDPRRTAIRGADGDLDYGTVAARALRLAAWLTATGVRAGDPVAVTLPKGADQIIAVLGVLAAGGMYVPIGVDQPPLRRARILARAGVSVTVDAAALTAAAGCTPLPAPVEPAADASAYVIFTSGSTGEPKGVEVSHRAAVNTVEEVNERFDIGPGDRVLAVSALDFDLSVYDIFGPLAAGGSIVTITEDERRDAARWAELVRRHGITVWNTVPALLDMLLVAAGERGLRDSLRLALVSGDWVGLDLQPRLSAASDGHCLLVALGGATEAAIWSNALEIERVPAEWVSVPYGFPLRNQRYRVVDESGRDRPDWVPGELWIGGAGVATGYRGDAELTAQSFVEYDGGRWYRTGDLGRYWPDGTLEFLGRADHQVKIRGHRIELGEVEHALEQCAGVWRAVVTPSVDRRRLFAAITAESEVDSTAVLAAVAERLPAHMVPDLLVVLPEIPLTVNGKIDRARVCRELTEHATPEQLLTPPRGETEIAVAAVWAEVLGVGEIGRESDFFLLGGDSLVATRLIARLAAAGFADAGLDRLFGNPRLADFAATVHSGRTEDEPSVALRPDPANRHEPFPCTDVQRAYLLGRSGEFVLGGVGAHSYFEFDGVDVDPERLAQVWNRLIRRHEMLRAVFDADGRQRILAEVPRFTIEVTEAGTDEQAALAALREELSHRVTDLSTWPLFDIRAVRHGGNRLRIGISLDNIVFDGMSTFIVLSEAARLYVDPDAELSTVDVSFRDYLLAVEGVDLAKQSSVDYWLDRLPALPAAPQLPLAVDPATVVRPHFTRRSARLPARDWQRIKDLARAHRLTPSAVLLHCYAEVLAAWSAQQELTVNLTLFDRRDLHPDLANIVGDFTSLALFAHQPEPGESWVAAVRRTQGQLARDLEHRDFSAVRVQRELARRLGSVAAAAMPVVFTSALGLDQSMWENLAAARLEQVWAISQTPQVWLDQQVYEAAGDLVCHWDAVAELFPAGLLDAMFAAYRDLVWRLAEDPAAWVQPLPELLPADQQAVRQRVNQTDGPEPDRLLHEGFFAMAAAAPERIALCWDGGELTYRELAERALRVAGHLVAAGVKPGDSVAITLPKGPAQITAVLGALAAGGCYVPIGVDHPAERQERIRRIANVVTSLDKESIVDAQRAAPLPAPIRVDRASTAYLIATSGSTGEPKGVEVSHRAAVNTVEDINERFGVGPEDRVLAVSGLEFDLSVYDIFGLLAAGGALVLIGEEERREAGRWLQLCREHRVTVWNTVPALLDMLLAAGETAEFPPLRLALLSGDWVGLDLPARLRAATPDCRLVALGGATEAAIWSNALTVREVPRHWTSVPYGFPLRNQRYRVVDERGRDRPDWAPGELWIGGVGVATGYRGDPERTAARFVEHDGQRWYRTGDLGRYWPDGTLEFLGRVDHQVKIRGHRIELGEVEAAIEAHPLVRQAVAIALGERGHQRLHAFVLEHENLDTTGMHAFLGERLPAYAVPPRIDQVTEFPLTANGKVDRKALAQLAEATGDQGGDEPRGELETRLAALWARLLGLPGLGRQENFFALGGDSVLAMKLVALVHNEFGLELSLRQLFAAPTIAALAALTQTQQLDPELSFEEGAL